MSERRRRTWSATLQLQRELAMTLGEAVALEQIPPDWSMPAVEPTTIRIAVSFSGTVPADALPEAIKTLTHSRRSDLAGVAWTYLALAAQGCAAIVVPEAFLTEATQGHMRLRRQLTEEGRVQGIVRLASGIYKPRVSAALVVLGPADAGPVWFSEVTDAAEMPREASGEEVSAVGTRWRDRRCPTGDPARNGPDFLVPRDEIAAARFDWSPERYRRNDAPASSPLRPAHEILTELAGLEAEIFQGIRDVVGALKR